MKKILISGFSLLVFFSFFAAFGSACEINCTHNWDCGPGELCLNAGTCIAYCQEENKSNQVALQNEAASGKLILDGLLGIRVNESSKTLRITVINANYDSVYNVSFTVLLPDLTASKIDPWKRHSGVSYEVFDGGARFFIEQIATAELVRIDHLPQPANETEWSIENITYDSDVEMDFSTGLDARNKWLTVWTNSTYNGSFTKVEIALDPHMRLTGVSVPVEIPKCMALYAQELQLGGEYVILRDDPLIVWQFADVLVPETISFFVPKEIPADCLSQVSVGVVVSSAKKGLPAWLTLAIIPLIAVILLFFQQFGKRRR